MRVIYYCIFDFVNLGLIVWESLELRKLRNGLRKVEVEDLFIEVYSFKVFIYLCVVLMNLLIIRLLLVFSNCFIPVVFEVCYLV